MDELKLFNYCKQVLQQNDIGGWTRPAPGLYPHQWLWDSCFIAIGQRHYNVKRAQKEIKNLFRGQWSDGMIPNIIYGNDRYYADNIWSSRVSKHAPKNFKTSGITQPPLIAEAVVKIGEKLSVHDRKEWYKSVFPNLLRYHEWLYRERDPRNEGIVVLVHPWESGLDNNPGWMTELHLNEKPFWIRAVQTLRLNKMFDFVRHDTKYLPAYERVESVDQLLMFAIARRLKRKKYETRLILRHAHVLIEDLAFNAILVRANTLLAAIARDIHEDLPVWLWERMKKAPHALELLWDEAHQQYFSRNFETFEGVAEPSIMTFLPLYAGTITKARAAQLVNLMKTKAWTTKYPLPSVPKNSKYFQPYRYWQGPTWVNTNWLIIEGLKRYGYTVEAEYIRKKTLELVQSHGAYEYFNPLDGSPVGAHPFSWTAALAIDLINP